MITIELSRNGYPYAPTYVHETDNNTPYFKSPGVYVLSKPQIDTSSMRDFLGEFHDDLKFSSFLSEFPILPPGAKLCKTAGQLCYLSFGPKRTYDEEAGRYFNNIKAQGHGSIMEHANYTLLFYGISRSCTHELVRHRAGFAFSQVSQRYVSGRTLRFVERPEFQNDQLLHSQFIKRIDTAAESYEQLAERLYEMQDGGVEMLGGDSKVELRKKVQQVARAVLPNETEAPIMVTGNARAWRHFLEMRASEHAETEIRVLAFRTYMCLLKADSFLFNDYTIHALKDGTCALSTEYRKV